MVAQNQTRATALINEATQRDSSVMRTVAIVTMTFLPATFVTVSTDNYVVKEDYELTASRHSLACLFLIIRLGIILSQRCGSSREKYGFTSLSLFL